MGDEKENAQPRTCGCDAGICLMTNDHFEVERCDECKLFETDEDAAHAVDALLTLLGRVYEQHRGDTVAGALDRIVQAVEYLELGVEPCEGAKPSALPEIKSACTCVGGPNLEDHKPCEKHRDGGGPWSK